MWNGSKKNMKKSELTKIMASALIAVSVLVLNPAGVSAEVTQNNTNAGYAADDTIVLATIGEDKITQANLDKKMSAYTNQLNKEYGEGYAANPDLKNQLTKLKKQVLQNMIMEKILLKKAAELNIKPSDDSLNKEIDDTISAYKAQYPNEGQFESLLQQNGMTEDDFRGILKNQIIINAIEQYMVKDALVADSEIQAYYDQNKNTEYTVGPGAIASHILIAERTDDGHIDYASSLQKANLLKAQIDGGADFAGLAKEYSKDPGTKDNGGILGFVPYDSKQLITEFMDGFKALKEGQVSEPVKSQFGYHLIKATGIKDGEVIPLDEVKDEIKTALLQQKQRNIFTAEIEEWMTYYKVQTYEDKLQ
jgi:foldase protein PrsA